MLLVELIDFLKKEVAPLRKFTSRGLDLEQYKEPAISHPIKSFYDVKTVFLPVSEDLCITPNEKLCRGKLISRGIRPESVDSFSSIDGTAVAVGEFEFEKFEGLRFLRIDANGKTEIPDMQKYRDAEISDEDIAFAINECGILNTTDKRTLKEIYEEYPNGVRNLVIDAIDDEPYVSSRISQLLFRSEHIVPAIRALNRVFGAKNIRIDIYDKNDDITIRMPHNIGGYTVNHVKQNYPVSRMMRSDKETVYIGVGALLSFYYSAVDKCAWTYTIVTVAGDSVKNPTNIEVPIGTPIGDILDFCGLVKKPKTVILGGSMTGYIVNGTDIPVLRSTKAVLAFSEELSCETYSCIGCGKCIDVCPEELLPYYIYTYYLDNNIEKLYRLSADRCTECGCCSYICPAKIDLRQYVKLSRRTLLKEMWQNEQNGQDRESTVCEK